MIKSLAVAAAALATAACGSVESIQNSEPIHTLTVGGDIHDITECLIDKLGDRADIVQFVHPTAKRAKLTARSEFAIGRTYFWQISLNQSSPAESVIEYRRNRSHPLAGAPWGLYVKDAIDDCTA